MFDLDDTLYPEREYVRSGMRAVAAWAHGKLGLPPDRSFRELWRLFRAGVRSETFDRWLESHRLDPTDWVPTIVQVYRRHQPQIAPYPGVRPLLGRLRREYRLGVVTDGFPQVQRGKLAAIDLGHYFQAVVYSDELGRDAWKPSPRPFQLVLRRLGVAGNEAVYVADNPRKDFRGARRVGMATVRLRHPDGLYRHLEPAAPTDAPEMEVAGFQQLEMVMNTQEAIR